MATKTAASPATVHAASKSGPAAPPADPPVNTAQTTPTPETDAAPETDDFVILTPELAARTTPKHARSDEQTKVDSTVKRLHAQWVSAGSPTGAWSEQVKARAVATRFMSPDAVPEYRKRLGRSASFLGLRVKYGTPFTLTEELAKKYGRPDSDVGREAVSVCVMDKISRDKKVTVK